MSASCCQPRVGHRNHADVGVDRTERVVLGSDLRARQRVEQSRLADIRQTYDAAPDSHVSKTLLNLKPGSTRRRVEYCEYAGGSSPSADLR